LTISSVEYFKATVSNISTGYLSLIAVAIYNKPKGGYVEKDPIV